MTEPVTRLKPHKGQLMMILGILSLIVGPPVVSVITWFMAHDDLKEKAAGRMDSAGRKRTQTARLLAIVGTVLWPCLLFCCCGGMLVYQFIEGGPLISAVGSHRITRAEFDRVRADMTKKEVAAILGRPARTEYRDGELCWYWYEKNGRATFDIRFDSHDRVQGQGIETPD
jgi:hypothetical protein